MARIAKPTPPEHIVLLDTNILWDEDKSHPVNPDFDAFWAAYSGSFPMKLILPDVVRGELLYQQTSSAMKLLEKANQSFSEISKITRKAYSHRVDASRLRREIEERFQGWVDQRGAEVKAVPISEIRWDQVICDSIWRKLPFTPDPKNPKNEKGFRDYMILETVCSVSKFYSDDVNIAFVCGDYALRSAAEQRLGNVDSFSVYESIEDFTSFIELTKRNLTERFVKSILSRATIKFHDENDIDCLIYKNEFLRRLRDEYKSELENPSSDDPYGFLMLGKNSWKFIGKEQVWVSRPQFQSLNGENEYHWRNTVNFWRLYERESEGPLGAFSPVGEKRLMVLAIDVFWKSAVRADGRFFDCEIVKYKKVESTFKNPSDQQLERYGIQTVSRPNESGGVNPIVQ